MDMLNEFQETYNQFLIRKAENSRIPIMGTFELTPVCNMQCNMCYIQQNGKSVLCKGGLKDIDFWERVIDQSIDAGMLFCLLTGGEILTYPHFKELYMRLKNKGIHIVLNTNGTLLDEETVQWLSKNPPRRLNISLYGASGDTYEKLCHYRDGFDKIMKAFELLNQYHIPYRVHGVLVPSNIHEYERIKQICNQFQAPLEMSYYMFPPVRKEMDHLQIKERFTADEMANTAYRYRKDQCGGNTDVWHKFLQDKCHLISHPEESPLYGYNKIACKNGICTFWVNWKGHVSGCGISDENCYDLEKISFENAWKQIKEYVDNLILSSQCSVCQYRCICPICVAGSYCETGCVDGTPEYLCEFSQKYALLLQNEYERIKNNE